MVVLIIVTTILMIIMMRLDYRHGWMAILLLSIPVIGPFIYINLWARKWTSAAKRTSEVGRQEGNHLTNTHTEQEP